MRAEFYSAASASRTWCWYASSLAHLFQIGQVCSEKQMNMCITSNKLESRAQDVERADEHVEETQQQDQLPH